MKKRYYKPAIITFAIILLNLIFSFDARSTIINFIWLLPFKQPE